MEKKHSVWPPSALLALLRALAHRCLWRWLPKHSVIIQAGLVICSRFLNPFPWNKFGEKAQCVAALNITRPCTPLRALARPCTPFCKPLRTVASGTDCQNIQSSPKLAQSYDLDFRIIFCETILKKKRSVWLPSALLALARPCTPLRILTRPLARPCAPLPLAPTAKAFSHHPSWLSHMF